ncbi:SYF2 splicing factor-domain-containing protein [Jimgerdemannia flammicorona]|uniref:Pre-mRNA-splicing factor SYF2 n=1 Tax=Jimgerdemannia flammicorona TaxID=994334 RepID=A0A433QJF0_9FUNG|nr:SYF2 splicing factor-domain-containing protein [Jimgerdemannia flammicorona]
MPLLLLSVLNSFELSACTNSPNLRSTTTFSLQLQQTEVEEGNRRDRNEEFQRSKVNPREEAKVERKRREAEILMARKVGCLFDMFIYLFWGDRGWGQSVRIQVEDAGEDWERKRAWNYSAEAVEKWEEKQEKRAKRAEHGFTGSSNPFFLLLSDDNPLYRPNLTPPSPPQTDYGQLAHRKYEKLVDDLKPDMSSYHEHKAAAAAAGAQHLEGFYGDANALELAGDAKPSREAVDRLVTDLNKQIEKRENRSRKRKEVEDDISWINERNRVFNQKIARFYDKYTKEIRENFERGTAL